MTHPHQLHKPDDVRAFVFAGNARLTLVSRRTGQRFTYRVRCPREGAPYFVSVLVGNDNETSYAYLGHYRGKVGRWPEVPRFEHGRKSKITTDAPSAKAWRFFDRVVNEDDSMRDDLEVWHEGRCGRCGRALTVPESIERGIGPECIKHFSS